MDEPNRARAPQGTLSPAEAADHLRRGDAFLASGDLQDAAGLYQRVVGYPDSAITAAALLGIGNVYFRASQEDLALTSWRAAAAVGETPSSYSAWRSIAAQLVRQNQLLDAIKAYREADRRAPSSDKAEIASRLGWLAKETGNAGAARRYFARSRGDGLPFSVSYALIAITVVAYLVAPPNNSPDSIFGQLLLDKGLVASGQYWRLFTVALLHESPIHLAFNMYALFLVGPVVEKIYGWKLFLFMYLACDLAASVASFVFGDPLIASVGASGAIFGLFGCLFVAGRLHNPVLDRQSRSLAAQIGTLIVLNLVLDFTVGAGTIDNFAHVGGLLAGGWLGAVLLPRGVPTLASGWVRTSGLPLPTDPRAGTWLRVLAVVALLVLCVVGVIVGSDPSRFSGLQ
ncbi:MAG TPA: rhomboid family intramembrane serine protease [Candidatus Limnocylindrales bacterium]|nr:rhomboid family intramembrane serine protease [Candidatus Limnocylindrales bacterium]